MSKTATAKQGKMKVSYTHSDEFPENIKNFVPKSNREIIALDTKALQQYRKDYALSGLYMSMVQAEKKVDEDNAAIADRLKLVDRLAALPSREITFKVKGEDGEEEQIVKLDLTTAIKGFDTTIKAKKRNGEEGEVVDRAHTLKMDQSRFNQLTKLVDKMEAIMDGRPLKADSEEEGTESTEGQEQGENAPSSEGENTDNMGEGHTEGEHTEE